MSSKASKKTATPAKTSKKTSTSTKAPKKTAKKTTTATKKKGKKKTTRGKREHDITVSALRKIARRAGGERIAAPFIVMEREIAQEELETFVRDLVLYAQNAKRGTIKPEDVREVAAQRGVELVASVPERGKGTGRYSSKGSTKAKSEVRKLQKSEKLILPDAAVKRLVKTVARQYIHEDAHDIHMGYGSSILIAYYIEDFLGKLIRDAIIIRDVAGKKKLMSKFLEAANEIRLDYVH